MKYFEQFYARKLDNLDEMGKFQERQNFYICLIKSEVQAFPRLRHCGLILTPKQYMVCSKQDSK